MATVALPIENQVREFDGKLWLGINFIERGYNVVLGPSWEIKPTLDITKPDVYFTKDVGDGNIEFIQDLQNSGMLVYGISPEVAIDSKMKYYTQNKKQVINYLDKYFAWGTDQAEALEKKYGNLGDKVEVTGNPRFDLLVDNIKSVYAERGERIRDEYGDYILFNTNFVLGNNTIRENIFENIRRLQPDRNPVQEERLYSRVLYTFLELIIYLASEEIDRHIVVRPHQNEDHSTYYQAFEYFDGVSVEHEGDARSWIHGADGVIHFSCTTGIEAAIMKTPVLSYQSVTDTITEKPLPQIVSQSTTKREEVKEWITEAAVRGAEHTLSKQQKSEVRRYFPNIDRPAAPLICDTVDSSLNDASGYSGYHVDTKQRIERQIKASPVGTEVVNLYDWIRDFLWDERYRELRANRKKKFPGITFRDIERKTDIMAEKKGINGIHIEKVPQTKYTYSMRK